jgi:hypothetical protein
MKNIMTESNASARITAYMGENRLNMTLEADVQQNMAVEAKVENNGNIEPQTRRLDCKNENSGVRKRSYK